MDGKIVSEIFVFIVCIVIRNGCRQGNKEEDFRDNFYFILFSNSLFLSESFKQFIK